MKNRFHPFYLLLVMLLAGCAPSVDEKLISYFPAPADQIALAEDAVDICGRTPKAYQFREALFRSLGFSEPDDPELHIMAKQKRGTVLVKPGSDVVVQLGGDGGRSGCIVGVKGMTPQQSFDLALPWVQKYEAVSNEELGQGLTHNAIQAWRTSDEDPTVFIAAYKTWDVLGVPGAAVRISR